MTSDVDVALRALAGAKEQRDFVLRRGDRVLDVRYATDNDDETTSLSLSVSYDAVARAHPGGYRDGGALVATRPLDLELRRETLDDAAAKARGVSAEWQSGDGTFDRAVYVGGPTRDPIILAAVLGPEARDAVLELLGLGFESVRIDTEARRVEADLPRSRFAADGEGRAERALSAFERLVDHLPLVRPSGDTHPAVPLRGWTSFLTAIGALGWALNVGYVGLLGASLHAVRGAEVDLSPTAAALLLGLGVAAGAVGAGAYRDAVARRMHGSPDAHVKSGRAALAAFGGISVLVFTLAFFVAAALGVLDAPP